MSALLDRLPTWLKAALWLAVSAFVTAALNALATGQFAVRPEFVPVVNVVLVMVRDFARTRAGG